MSTIAIITARGGSKRIPRKNIKDFCGKPILAYSIDAALKSGVFDEVMVSTDDEEIAQIAKQYGAKVPFFRSAEMAGDFATTPEVCLEVLDEYEKRGQTFDIGCVLYPTAPFTTAQRLRDAVRNLEESDADSLIPVVQFSYPVQRSLILQEGRLVFEQPEYLDSRSQDLVPHFHDAGSFIIFRTQSLRTNHRLMVGNILPMVLNDLEVQDIDNETDWKLAELKYRLLHDRLDVSLRRIREDDLEQIMNWRMQPEITRYMNTDPKLTLEGQVRWLEEIRRNPDLRYWVIEVKGQPAGVINLKGLSDPSGEIGWAYYIGEKKLSSMELAITLEISMYDYVFRGLGKKAVISDVFSLNRGVITLHKICGCEVVEEKKNAVEKEGVFFDVTYLRMTAERWEMLNALADRQTTGASSEAAPLPDAETPDVSFLRELGRITFPER
ncbi:MAG: pseudaminic acid cytidylyltransferase [Lachnospiraceae bacterium]|nr:pseudaminic acid cytidylyltransferase [Lachnospiraceae bacterium]